MVKSSQNIVRPPLAPSSIPGKDIGEVFLAEVDVSRHLQPGGGGGALECNLTGRCPFFKNLDNLFMKKFAFRYPVSGLFDYKNFQEQQEKQYSIVLESNSLMFLNKQS